MDNDVVEESLVTFQCGQTGESRGKLLCLGCHFTTFEIYSPEVVLRTSTALQELKIFPNERVIYSGGVVVESSPSPTPDQCWCVSGRPIRPSFGCGTGSQTGLVAGGAALGICRSSEFRYSLDQYRRQERIES